LDGIGGTFVRNIGLLWALAHGKILNRPDRNNPKEDDNEAGRKTVSRGFFLTRTGVSRG
jgi:hypothetical protein